MCLLPMFSVGLNKWLTHSLGLLYHSLLSPKAIAFVLIIIKSILNIYASAYYHRKSPSLVFILFYFTKAFCIGNFHIGLKATLPGSPYNVHSSSFANLLLPMREECFKTLSVISAFLLIVANPFASCYSFLPLE